MADSKENYKIDLGSERVNLTYCAVKALQGQAFTIQEEVDTVKPVFTCYTLRSVCTFSILFSVHFLR